MSDSFSWKNKLKRTADSLKRKFRRSRNSLFKGGDGSPGFSLNSEWRRSESVERPDSMADSWSMHGGISTETKMGGAENSGEHSARNQNNSKPLADGVTPAEDSPPLVRGTRLGDSRVTPPLPLATGTRSEASNVNESSPRETPAEGSRTNEDLTEQRLSGKKPCLNKFLSNDPLAGESSIRQSLRGTSSARESEVEELVPRERDTSRPDMESSARESFLDPNILEANSSEEPEHVEDEQRSEHMEEVEQFEHDENSEWFEHIEHAHQDTYASPSTYEFPNSSEILITCTSTSASPDPKMRRPYHPLAIAENNRLLRLPLEIRLMIYDELLAQPRTVSLLYPQREKHPLHSIRKVDKELFTRRARLRFKYSAPSIGYYDPRTTTFAARFTDDEHCTHRQWGSEYLGPITNFGPRAAPTPARPSAPPPYTQQPQAQLQPRPRPQPQPTKSRGSALLYGICSFAAKHQNLSTWQAIHRHLVHAESSRAIRVLELEFPRICSAINVLKSLVLGRMHGWRELRRLSVLRIRIRREGGGPLNEVDMVVLYSLAVTLSEEMERKVLLRRGPWIEMAW